MIAIFFILSIFIITNSVKLSVFSRRTEISIMKYVGATDMFIRLPFIVEGLLLGLLSASVAFLLIWGLYSLLVHWLAGEGVGWLTFLTENLVPFGSMALPLMGCFLFVGVAIGTLGSIIFVRKYLKV